MIDKNIKNTFAKLENKVDDIISNLRKVELEKKDINETITEEEKGELYGLRVFPNNLRGQKLKIKEHLNTLSSPEKEELRRLCQLKTRQEKMTSELQNLWERTESNDSNVVQVSMNDGKYIKVLSSDKQEKVIWTHSLCGCNASLVFSEDEYNTKIVILTHFMSTMTLINITKLKELIRSNSSMKTSKYKQFILFLQEEFEQNIQTKKWESKSKYDVSEFISMIKEELGQNVEIKIEPYSTLCNDMEKDVGTLIVRVPPKGKSTYKTWFSQGQLGINYE